jgi:hypothetical protein
VHIPAEIRKKIQDATHFLFIGFDFSKWYNRLLLFILDFEQKKSGTQRMTIGAKNIKEEIEKFISKQFNITFVDNDYNLFIDWLINNVSEEGILRNLNKGFVQSSFAKLKNLSANVGLEDRLEELQKFEQQFGVIAGNIRKFQQKISG